MEIIYNGYDNVVKFQVLAYQGNVLIPADFSGVTSMRLEIPSLALNITSGITWTSEGEITLSDLGQAGLLPGQRPATLIAFDPSHPNGQVIVHESSGGLTFKITG